jgi:ElaB/YqjD/DUF883 family membrane-anchored ribosome-binding protein
MNTNASANVSGKDGNLGSGHSTAASVSSPTAPDYSHISGGAEHFNAHSYYSQLHTELSNLKSDFETLMSRASSLNANELRTARDRIMAKFSSMQDSAKGMASKASQKASDARVQMNQGVDVTTEYIKERPLQSVAIAAGVGFLLGALLRRD